MNRLDLCHLTDENNRVARPIVLVDEQAEHCAILEDACAIQGETDVLLVELGTALAVHHGCWKLSVQRNRAPELRILRVQEVELEGGLHQPVWSIQRHGHANLEVLVQHDEEGLRFMHDGICLQDGRDFNREVHLVCLSVRTFVDFVRVTPVTRTKQLWPPNVVTPHPTSAPRQMQEDFADWRSLRVDPLMKLNGEKRDERLHPLGDFELSLVRSAVVLEDTPIRAVLRRNIQCVEVARFVDMHDEFLDDSLAGDEDDPVVILLFVILGEDTTRAVCLEVKHDK